MNEATEVLKAMREKLADLPERLANALAKMRPAMPAQPGTTFPPNLPEPLPAGQPAAVSLPPMPEHWPAPAAPHRTEFAFDEEPSGKKQQPAYSGPPIIQPRPAFSLPDLPTAQPIAPPQLPTASPAGQPTQLQMPKLPTVLGGSSGNGNPTMLAPEGEMPDQDYQEKLDKIILLLEQIAASLERKQTERPEEHRGAVSPKANRMRPAPPSAMGAFLRGLGGIS